MEWDNKSGLMIADYFENKQKFLETRVRLVYLRSCAANGSQTKEAEKLGKEVAELEKRIRAFIDGLTSEQLKSVIYMSLDMSAEEGGKTYGMLE